MIGIYEDRALSKRVREFHLGTVEAGEVQTETYYIFNNTDAELHDFNILFPKGQPKGLEILLPKVIKPRGIDRLVITWKPPLTLRKALSVEIRIAYKEIYIARK